MLEAAPTPANAQQVLILSVVALAGSDAHVCFSLSVRADIQYYLVLLPGGVRAFLTSIGLPHCLLACCCPTTLPTLSYKTF